MCDVKLSLLPELTYSRYHLLLSVLHIMGCFYLGQVVDINICCVVGYISQANDLANIYILKIYIKRPLFQLVHLLDIPVCF
jgi:hypothetical protein